MKDLQAYLDKALKEVHIVKEEDENEYLDYDVEAEVCELIVMLRTQRGMTQKQLAERSGVSQANISKIENGSYRPSIPTLKKIAYGLGKRLTIGFEEVEGE